MLEPCWLGHDPPNAENDIRRIMYVKCKYDTLKEYKTPEMDEIAEFSDNNIAQVKESDGKILIEKDGFSEHTN